MEKTVELVFEKATPRMYRFTNPEVGVIYLPKFWFEGQPEKCTMIVRT